MEILSLVLAALMSIIFSFNIGKTTKSLITITLLSFIVASIVNLVFTDLNSMLISSGISIALFFVLFFTGILSKKTTFLLPAVFATLTVSLWWAFIPGFIINSIISIVKIAKNTGIKDVGTTAAAAYVNTKYGKVEDIRNMVEGPNFKTRINFFLWNAVGLLVYIPVTLLLP